jgi:HEAT repeat protein
MDSKIFSHASHISDCTDDLPNQDIRAMIKGLSSPDNSVRMEMRNVLTCIGAPAVPELLKAMEKADTNMRWQIIKVFESIRDPQTIPILMDQLDDDDAEVRWAASNALINLRRQVLPALFDALIHRIDSIWLRQSAHHILHVLKDNGRLSPLEEKVYDALEEIEPSVAVPWAAEKALMALNSQKNNLLR